MAKSPKTTVEVCRRRRMRILNFRDFVSLIFRLALIVLAIWFLLSNVFIVTQSDGMGMFPALEDGDLILGYRLETTFEKGDVVIYQKGDAVYIGRIVAFATDTVMMDDSGKLLVNGTTQAGEIMYPTYAKEGIEYPYRVHEDHIFVLGDYRTQTQDSRDFGAIPMDNLLGKVITIVRRRGV